MISIRKSATIRFIVIALCAATLQVSATPTRKADIRVSGYDGSTPLANFPVLVRVSPTTIDGFSYADCAADGRDVAFADAEGVALPREIDTWNTSGESLVWVRLPVCTNNASFSMTWGDAAIASQPACQTDGSVWTAAGYVGVWHMSEASGTVADATAHGLTATPGGDYTANSIAVSGKIGNARQNAASASQPGNLVVPNYDAFNVGNTFAVGGWFYLTDNSSSDNRFFSRKETYTESGGWEIMHKGGQSSLSNRKINVRGKTNSKTITSSGLDIAGTGWNHFLFVYNGTSATVYRNGEALTTSGTIEAATDNGQTMGIGSYRVAAASCIVGNIDECRLLDAVPSADWAKAEFAQGDNASFLTYGEAKMLAAEGAVNIRGEPASIGSPTPAYGLQSDVSTITFSMPVTVVAGEGTVSNFLAGWTLDAVDLETSARTRLHASSDPGASISSFTYVHEIPYAEFTWLWDVREELGATQPTVTCVATSSADLSIAVTGIGYEGFPALTLAYGTSPDALDATNTVAASVTAPGVFSTSPNGLEPDTTYYARAILTGPGGVIVLSDAVSFTTTSLGLHLFLKEDATGACDGSSWTDAFTSWSNALVAVRAIGNAEPVTLHIAKGIYQAPSTEPISTAFPTAITNSQFALYGGCRAAYDGDLERDPETYQTFVTTTTRDKVLSAYWKRVEPDESGYGYTETNVKDGNADFTLLDSQGRLRIPEFIGEHDTFTTSQKGGYIPILIGAGAGGTIDGLRFICCSRGSNRQGLIRIEQGAGDIDITNCVFTASDPQSGCIIDGAGRQSGLRRVTDCKFIFNRVSWGTVGVTSKGGTIVRDCLFLGNVQTTDNSMRLLDFGQAAPVDKAADAADRLAEDCVFTRNFTAYSKPGDTMIASGGCVMRRLVITNNYFATRQAGVTILVNLAAQKNYGAGMMEDCLIADNTALTIPTSGSISLLVAGYNKDRNSTPAIVNTVFRDNAFLAPSNDVAATACAFGVVGNRAIEKSSTWMTVQGCTFVSNRVEVSNLAEGASVVRSRGLLSYNEASSHTAYGFANCTFFGPAEEGLYDIVQFGSHTEPLNIVNCVFALDDPNAVANPILSDYPDTINLHGCAVQNWYDNLRPTGFGALTSLKYDPVPLVPIAKGPGSGFVMRPAAWTPGLRETCDVATNGPPTSSGYAFGPVTYSFRLPGGEWQRLLPQSPSTDMNVKSPVADALGAARAFGSYTAGAVQALTPAAENGSTLTLRREPFAGGTLSVPFVQAAASGDAYVPVTATPIQGGGFGGWLDENGDVYSSANPLTLVAPPTNLVLTASFNTALVNLVFDLGQYGTFDENGESTITIIARADTTFPEIPAFTVLGDHHFVSWSPEVPAIVPVGGASFTAKIVSTELRRIYAAPDGIGDGSSWANAAGLASAYEEASAYRGEVWLKEGTYTLASPLTLMANVSVIGGFAGGEASVAEADPAAHPVILSGTAFENLYWKPEGTDPGVGNRTAIWNDGVFSTPNSAWTNEYWQPASLTMANDARYAFADELGNVATNVSFSGITFTGFSRSAVYSVSGTGDGATFRDCRFLANGTAASADHYAVHFTDSPVSLSACDFIGNYRACRTSLSRPYTNEIADCRFTDNARAGIALSVSTNASSFEIVRCLFTRNYADNSASALSITTSTRFGPAHVSDCQIVSNRVYSGSGGGAVVTISVSDPGNYAGTPILSFDRCDFSDNVARKTRGVVLSLSNRYGSLQFRDCNFLRNMLAEPQGVNPPVGGIVYDDAYAVATFVNCLFEGNTAYAKDKAGVILVNTGDYRRGALFNCTFVDNDITAEDPLNAADFRIGTGNGIGSFKIVNCIFDERGSGHFPIRCNAGAKLDLWNVFTYGQTTNDMGAGTFGLIDGYGPFTADPRLQKTLKSGPGGRMGRTISGSSPASRGGLVIQRAADGNYFVYCPWLTGTNDKPWCAPSIADLTLSAGADLGLDLSNDAIPDAWGQARPAGKPIAAGHLNAARAETMIIMR